jgi:aconitate hydratase
LALPVLLKVGDNVSTDEIVQGGVTGLSLWSSLPGMTSLAFKPIDESYVDRARDCHGDGHAIIGGRNYAQGSSREQAALAVRNLGARVVLAHSICAHPWREPRELWRPAAAFRRAGRCRAS